MLVFSERENKGRKKKRAGGDSFRWTLDAGCWKRGKEILEIRKEKKKEEGERAKENGD